MDSGLDLDSETYKAGRTEGRTDRLGHCLWDVPLIEKNGTNNIRMTMMDAGYDVSAWPMEVI